MGECILAFRWKLHSIFSTKTRQFCPSCPLSNPLTSACFNRTLIDSTPGVLKAWKTFSDDYNLGDSETVAHATHGRRLYDTLKEYCGIEEEDLLLVRIFLQVWRALWSCDLIQCPQQEIDRFEDEVIEGGPMALPGAIDLLTKVSSSQTFRSSYIPHSLIQLHSHPATNSKWTIVTSGMFFA